MKKRVCILYSGGIRSNGLSPNYLADSYILDSTTKFLLNDEFKAKYDYDVFFSTDKIDLDKARCYFGDNLKNIHLSPDYDEGRRKDGIDWYLNDIEKKIPQYEYFYNKYVTTTNFNNCWSNLNVIHQFYRLYSVYNLMKNYQIKTNTKYDYLIRIRPDSMLKQDFMPFLDYIESTQTQLIIEHENLCILKYTLKDIFKVIKEYGRYQKPVENSNGILSHLNTNPNHLLIHEVSNRFCPERQFMEHVNDIINRNNSTFKDSCVAIMYPSLHTLYRGNDVFAWAHIDDIPRETITSIIERRYYIDNIDTKST